MNQQQSKMWLFCRDCAAKFIDLAAKLTLSVCKLSDVQPTKWGLILQNK